MTDSDEIGDDELLYRKVAVKFGWFDPVRNEIKPDAFRPTAKHDKSGISVDRAWSEWHPDFRRLDEAAQGRQADYYVAVLQAGTLKDHGFVVVADPQPGNPGHALITDLTSGNRRDQESQEKTVLLAHRLVLRVEGPFPSR